MDFLTNDIHPILDPGNFDDDIDYDILLPSLRLASLVLLCPQSIHYYLAFYFGKNDWADPPEVYKDIPDVAPQMFACNKGVLEVDDEEREAVLDRLEGLASRIKLKLKACDSGVDAETSPEEDYETTRETGGCDSTVYLSEELYSRLLDDQHTSESRMMLQFFIASVIVHEIAHAAGFDLFGTSGDAKAYFENSLLTEAGFEYESRIWGFVPHYCSDEQTNKRNLIWLSWQTTQDVPNPFRFDLDNDCRNREDLPSFQTQIPVDAQSVQKLFTDQFWNETMAQQGPTAMIAPEIAWIYQGWGYSTGNGTSLPESIWDILPESIWDLFHGNSEAGSYAAQKYRAFDTSQLQLRSFRETDTGSHRLRTSER